jgi:hypothetical protein
MVKLTQNIQAAYERESSYGDPPDLTLSHLGLLDTFDPREVEMNITPIPSIGQSTDAHHASGPIDVTLPLKIACQGDGWKEFLGNAIGKTDVHGAVNAPHSLTNSTYSHAILAKDFVTNQHTLCTGIVVNEATLEADYTTGGYITLDMLCTAKYSEDDDNDDGNFTFNSDTYDGVAFPSAPTADPLLPTDLTVSYSTATDADALQITDTLGNYVEVGERYMRCFLEGGGLDGGYGTTPDPIPVAGVIDLNHSDYNDGNRMDTLKDDLNANSGNTVVSNSATTDPQNLLKGIYKMTAGAVNIPAVVDIDKDLTAFSNLKTVALKIANNNIPIAGKSGSTWVNNNKIARGKADITLELTMAAENEDIYTLYRDKTTLPLVRLNFGTNGSIALTNGTITAFSRPLTGGAEVVDTVTIKFRGNGDHLNYSAFAISADLSLADD